MRLFDALEAYLILVLCAAVTAVYGAEFADHHHGSDLGFAIFNGVVCMFMLGAAVKDLP